MGLFKKNDAEAIERRLKRKEHYLLSKKKFSLDNYFAPNFNNPSNIDLITVSFNNPIIIDYQIKLFKKFLKGNYCHIICDNSNKEERAKEIKEVCVKNNITYIHCEPRKIPHGFADSHGIALNWVYKEVVQKRKNNFALLDHDMFPMKEFDIESYLENAELAGRVDEISDIWYLWPGFSFFRYELLKNKRVNFRRHRKWYLFKVPRVDTGSANWYPLYSKYDKKKVKKVAFYGWNIVDNKPVKKEEIKGKFIQEKMVDYSSDKIWFHSTCGSEWRDVKGKNQIIYKILNSVLSDSITK